MSQLHLLSFNQLKRSSRKSPGKQQDRRKHKCQQFLNIKALVQYLAAFMDIHTLHAFSTTHKRILQDIQPLVRMILRNTLLETLDILNNGTAYNFIKNTRNISYIYTQNKNNCIHGTDHPFVTLSKFDNHCITFKEVHQQQKKLMSTAMLNWKDSNLLGYKLLSRDMILFHKLFKDTLISIALKSLMPFTPSKLSDCYVESYHIHKFMAMYKSGKFQHHAEITLLTDHIWQSFTTTHKGSYIHVTKYSEKTQIQLKDNQYFFMYFTRYFHLSLWIDFVNWNVNIIAGGAPFHALMGNKHYFPNASSDIDIFAYGISHEQWILELNSWEKNLIDANLTTINTITHANLRTYYLMVTSDDIVKIQFIFQCATANPAQILNSFDISPVQIAFNPDSSHITFTKAFVDYVYTGYAAIFNYNDKISNSSLTRIRKYHLYGVNQWKIPNTYQLSKFEHDLNNTNISCYQSQTAINLKIGKNYVDKFSYNEYNYRAYAKHQCIKSTNHDGAHLLKTFLNYYIHNDSA